MNKCKKKLLSFCLVFLMVPLAFMTPAMASTPMTSSTAAPTMINLSTWGIYNDGTHPVETTKGINHALKSLHDNGVTSLTLPTGTYLIDKDNQIEMVSDMTFTLDNNTTIKKETNDYAGYKLLDIGAGVNNVTLHGGTYEGDKLTHDFSKGGTQEGGYGILISGATNVTIDGVKAVNFTGDGLCIGAMGTMIHDFYAKDFQSGSIDSNGKVVHDPTKVRLMNLPITNPDFDIQHTFQLLHQRGLPKDAYGYVAFFYDGSGNYLSKLDTATTNTPVGWGLSPIPSGAKSMNLVFHTPSVPSSTYVEYWMQGVSKNITVENSEFAYNRRQGITIGGGQIVLIQNNQIHDMKGTAPQSGIDAEAGFNLNDGLTIENNHFYNNQAYDLILFDGKHATVDHNEFDSSSIGLAISEPFKYATVTNNTFHGARIYAYNDSTFKNNKMTGGLAAFLGNHDVIDGMDFNNTLVNIASSTPYGINVSNITVHNDGSAFSQFGINANPVHVKNVTIEGAAALDSFGGNAADGSTFDNLKVLSYKRVQLPRGTYTNCEFKAADGDWGPAVNGPGTYVFNQCTFEAASGLGVNSVHGAPDSVTITNSTIIADKDNVPAVGLTAGKNIDIENNTLTVHNLRSDTLGAQGAIQVGNYWHRQDPETIAKLTMKGNTINAKGVLAFGISTKYAGSGSSGYDIENNILNNAKLALRANDTNVNNKTYIEVNGSLQEEQQAAVTFTTRDAGFAFNSIASNGSQYVGVGNEGLIATSNDGIIWTKETSPKPTANLNDALFSNGRFIVAGNQGTILTSTDGQKWTVQDTHSKWATFTSVKYLNKSVIAVGWGGTVETSVYGGSQWDKHSLPKNSVDPLYDVAYNGSVYVAPTNFGYYYMSKDGVSWTKKKAPNSMKSITANGSMFIAVGGQGVILTSNDGINWTKQVSSTHQGLNGVVTNGNYDMAVGEGGTVLTSSSGVSWTAQPSNTTSELKHIQFVQDRFWITTGTKSLIIGTNH